MVARRAVGAPQGEAPRQWAFEGAQGSVAALPWGVWVGTGTGVPCAGAAQGTAAFRVGVGMQRGAMVGAQHPLPPP